MLRTIFTLKFSMLLLVEVLGFTVATAMLFTSVPVWIPALLFGGSLGFGSLLVVEVMRGRV